MRVEDRRRCVSKWVRGEGRVGKEEGWRGEEKDGGSEEKRKKGR